MSAGRPRPFGDMAGRTVTVRVPPMPPLPAGWLGSGASIPPQTATITVGLDAGGRPLELFVRLDGPGSIMQGSINAMARLASLALREGVPAARVVRAMRGQADGLPGAWLPGEGGGVVPSVADAVARVLEGVLRASEDP